jgi:hypothetical protein
MAVALVIFIAFFGLRRPQRQGPPSQVSGRRSLRVGLAPDRDQLRLKAAAYAAADERVQTVCGLLGTG